MTTIAEALGMALPEPERARAQGEGHEDAAPAGPVLEALAQESGREAGSIRPDMTLAGDLDLDVLGLYAVVTPAERALHTQIPDRRVQGLRTVRDLLDAFGAGGGTDSAQASSSPA